MTVAQLERAVARLGFAPSLEGGEALMRDAAERALCEIAAARPRVATATLYHYPAIPLYHEGSDEPFRGTRELRIPSGTVFFARLLGTGGLSLRRGNGYVGYQYKSGDGGQPAVITGEVPNGEGDITLLLVSMKESRLLDLAVYDLPHGSTAPDPSGPTHYDLALLYPDFGALIAPLRDGAGRPLTEDALAGYTLTDGHILSLPAHSAGRLTLVYRKRIPLPTEGELPLSDAEAALVPLYCAAYVLLDEDPDKAAFYLARFREGLLRLDEGGRGAVPYPDTTHWG